MRYLSILIFVGLLAGCSRTNEQTPISFAGNWSMKAYFPEDESLLLPGDRFLSSEREGPILAFEMIATDTEEGWSIRMGDREPEMAKTVKFRLERDTVTVTFGPFLSSFTELEAEGVQLSLTAELWMDGGRIKGDFRGIYDLPGGGQDSLYLRFDHIP